ncbi:MAG TPA: hypothetical protein VEU96_19195 [Bryobacteraceae bacterium]|nr:hypothetical protein [Bryobacteraceae bacterium]
MPLAPSGIVSERQIATAIQKAAARLAPEVERIRYALTSDSTGSAAIFFRVLLSDRASRPDGLYERTERITARILEMVRPRERFGVEAYFNFRSESEQAKLQDAAWE